MYPFFPPKQKGFQGNNQVVRQHALAGHDFLKHAIES